jgi:asparagine synthase (glutamine-hydrolysing)
MCGLGGILDPTGRVRDLDAVAGAMADSLAHRGPDGSGVWCDPSAGIAVGHRRLAVVDLSEHGAQPMVSRSGRVVVVFNGEVYDHRVIRAELEAAGHVFRGHADTEVLVEAIDRWGVRRALERTNAMCSVAVWERDRRVLTLARDRLGEKPMYHAMVAGAFVFGSELRALRVVPGFSGAIDPAAVAGLLQWSFVPHPRTIYRGVAQLPPGCLLEVRPDRGTVQTDLVQWWSVDDAARRGLASRGRHAPADAADRLEELLGDAVGLRLEADVPMGAFLSGGIDSSMVAALAQRALGSTPLRTFTVRMPEAGFDESADAAAVAAHLGTDHTVIDLSERDAIDAVPDLADVFDEPFADPSMLPTLLLCRATRSALTVSLAGDGGDEVFAGYNRHAMGQAVWDRVAWMPAPLRRGMARALLAPSPALVDRLAAGAGRLLPRRLDVRNPGDKVQKLGAMMRTDGSHLWATLASTWPDPAEVMVQGAAAPIPATERMLADPLEEMLLIDTEFVLPDEMLVKVDRASMAVGLEVRVPFLDHRVVEWAWTLPMEAKASGGQGKRIVREVLRRHVPESVVGRPKMGFDPPLATWLRGPLREWAEGLLSADRLRADGWLRPEAVRAVWEEHLRGARNWDYRLWSVLMFTAWLERHGNSG